MRLFYRRECRKAFNLGRQKEWRGCSGGKILVQIRRPIRLPFGNDRTSSNRTPRLLSRISSSSAFSTSRTEYGLGFSIASCTCRPVPSTIPCRRDLTCAYRLSSAICMTYEHEPRLGLSRKRQDFRGKFRVALADQSHSDLNAFVKTLSVLVLGSNDLPHLVLWASL